MSASSYLDASKYQSNSNPCILLIDIVQCLESRVHGSLLSDDEGKEFMRECDLFLTILPKDDFVTPVLVNPKQQRLSQENLSKECKILIKRITEQAQTAKSLAGEFLKEDDKQEKSLSEEKRIRWTAVDRPLRAIQLDEYIQTESKTILPRIKQLHFYYQLDDAFKQQCIKPLRQFMTSATYQFWVACFGQNNLEVSWKDFINAYQVLYGPLDLHMIQYIEKVVCQEGTRTVTIHCLISAVRKQNNQFPFPKTPLAAPKEKNG